MPAAPFKILAQSAQVERFAQVKSLLPGAICPSNASVTWGDSPQVTLCYWVDSPQ